MKGGLYGQSSQDTDQSAAGPFADAECSKQNPNGAMDSVAKGLGGKSCSGIIGQENRLGVVLHEGQCCQFAPVEAQTTSQSR